jgi:hypothetical protein
MTALGAIATALVDQLVAGGCPELMLDPGVEVGERLEDALAAQSPGYRLGHRRMAFGSGLA